MSTDGKEVIQARIRMALAHRDPSEVPANERIEPLRREETVALFVRRFTENGGEVLRFPDTLRARSWLAEFCSEFPAAAVGAGVPIVLAPLIPAALPEEAPLGVSLARLAVAETGSLLLDSREGRRVQLLPPCHLIWLREDDIVGSLGEALLRVKEDLPSALALHSGPSRSADIGQIMVRGVHGPGRTVVGMIGGR
jgi:L-lactate dehydrogenase complex protein LldG